MPAEIASPETTGRWEKALDEITTGKQDVYKRQALTYPRTDSRYLPQDMIPPVSYTHLAPILCRSMMMGQNSWCRLRISITASPFFTPMEAK